MTDNSDDKKQVLLDAKKMIHHIDLLISQCNSWLPAQKYGSKKKLRNNAVLEQDSSLSEAETTETTEENSSETATADSETENS